MENFLSNPLVKFNLEGECISVTDRRSGITKQIWLDYLNESLSSNYVSSSQISSTQKEIIQTFRIYTNLNALLILRKKTYMVKFQIVAYLVHIITQDGIKLSPAKLGSILNLPEHKKQKDIK